MWTTLLTCAEVAGFVRTLPVGVHSARRLVRLRSLLVGAAVVVVGGGGEGAVAAAAVVFQSYHVATFVYVTSSLFPVADYCFFNNLWEGK